MHDCDIVIVGAGPAGLSAAAALSKHRHLRVVLIERRKLGDPVGKSWTTWTPTVKRFGLESASCYRLTKILASDPARGAMHIDMSRSPLHVLDEKKVVRLLADRMTATVWEQTTVTRFRRESDCVVVSTSRGALRAKLLIDASGEGAIGRRHFRIRTDTKCWLHCEIRTGCLFTGSEVQWLHLHRPKHAGMPLVVGWMAPYSRTKVLVGTFAFTEHEIPLRTHRSTIRSLISSARWAPVFKRSTVASSFTSWLPMTPSEHFVFDRVIMVGDAASHTRPLTQEGFRTGLELGELAADVAVRATRIGRFDEKTLRKFAAEIRLKEARFFENQELNKLLQVLLRYFTGDEIDGLLKRVDTLPNRIKIAIARSELTLEDIERVVRCMLADVHVLSLVRRLRKKDRTLIVRLLVRYAEDLIEDDAMHLFKRYL